MSIEYTGLLLAISQKPMKELTALEGAILCYAKEFRAGADTAAAELETMRVQIIAARVFISDCGWNVGELDEVKKYEIAGMDLNALANAFSQKAG